MEDCYELIFQREWASFVDRSQRTPAAAILSELLKTCEPSSFAWGAALLVY